MFRIAAFVLGVVVLASVVSATGQAFQKQAGKFLTTVREKAFPDKSESSAGPPVTIQREMNVSLGTEVCGRARVFRTVLALTRDWDEHELQQLVRDAIIRYEAFEASADVTPAQFISTELRIHDIALVEIKEVDGFLRGPLTKKEAALLERAKAAELQR